MEGLSKQPLEKEKKEHGSPRIDRIFQEYKDYEYIYSGDEIDLFDHITGRIKSMSESGVTLTDQEKNQIISSLLPHINNTYDQYSVNEDHKEFDSYFRGSVRRLSIFYTCLNELESSFISLGIDASLLSQRLKGLNINDRNMIINAERDLDPMLLVEYLEYIETLDNLGPHELSKVIEQVNRSFKGFFYDLEQGDAPQAIDVKRYMDTIKTLYLLEERHGLSHLGTQKLEEKMQLIENNVMASYKMIIYKFPLSLATVNDVMKMHYIHRDYCALKKFKVFHDELGKKINGFIEENHTQLIQYYDNELSTEDSETYEKALSSYMKEIEKKIEITSDTGLEYGLYEAYSIQKEDTKLSIGIVTENQNKIDVKIEIAEGSIYSSMVLSVPGTDFMKIIHVPLLYELIQENELGKFIEREIEKCSGDVTHLSNYDIPMESRYLDFLDSGDTVVSLILLYSKLMKKTLKDRYHLKTTEQIVTRDFREALLNQVDDFYSQGERDFFINIFAHGGPFGLFLKEEVNSYNLFLTLHHKFPNTTFTFYTVACFGGGFVDGYKQFIKEHPKTTLKVNIFTEAHDTTPNYIKSFQGENIPGIGMQHIGSTSILHQVHKNIRSGDTFGEAYRKADAASKLKGEADGESIISKDDEKGYNYFSSQDYQILGDVVV